MVDSPPTSGDWPRLRQAEFDMERRWADYCEKQEEQKIVRPILLIQVGGWNEG
jgi:hypothetical protein